MGYALLGAWLIQAVVGIVLLIGWVRHGRGDGRAAVLVHIVMMCLWNAPWIAFLVTGSAVWPWISVVVLTAGIPFGEVLMTRRARRIRGETRAGLSDYGTAVGMVFAGRMPGRVAFHALFGAVVFFGSLGVAIGATVSGA